MRILEAAGYTCHRAAASKGIYDIVAWNEVGYLHVQVKSNAWPGAVEMEAIREDRLPPNAVRIIHRWDDYAVVPLVKEIS